MSHDQCDYFFCFFLTLFHVIMSGQPAHNVTFDSNDGLNRTPVQLHNRGIMAIKYMEIFITYIMEDQYYQNDVIIHFCYGQRNIERLQQVCDVPVQCGNRIVGHGKRFVEPWGNTTFFFQNTHWKRLLWEESFSKTTFQT